MARFSVAAAEPPRFDGEFTVALTEGEAGEADSRYLADVQALADVLASGAGREELGAARQKAVTAARADADRLAAGELEAAAASQQLAAIRSEYEAAVAAPAAPLEPSTVPPSTAIPQPDAAAAGPRFVIVDRAAVFEGYFSITAGGQPLDDADRSYLAAAGELLDRLRSDAQQDKDEEGTRARAVFDQHKAARKAAIDLLRAGANRVVTGKLASEAAATGARTILDGYKAQLARIDAPRFDIRNQDSPRFDGDFYIAAAKDAETTDAERAYVDKIHYILRRMALDATGDRDSGVPRSVVTALQDGRKNTASELRDRAQEVSQRRADPDKSANAGLMLLGKYVRDRELVAAKQFTVALVSEDTDIDIKPTDGLQPPNDVVPPDRQELYTVILSTKSVIANVCERSSQGDRSLCDKLFRVGPGNPADRARTLRQSYMRKLAEIARLGLVGPHTTLAKVALDSLRKEFVAHEGPRIKNSYVCQLGVAAGLFALGCVIMYTLIVFFHPRPAEAATRGFSFWYDHRPFLLAGAGAAIGTWMSFSVRQVELAFEHLGVIEEDLLDPAFRVLFVVALTVTAFLLFWTGVMSIKIGDLNTTGAAFDKNGTIALLIGLFCGLSERALASAVSSRAAAFVRGVGGG
jgi:hypothetical protein